MSLSPADLQNVLSELFSARDMWYEICLALGILSSTLDSIKKECDDPKVCIRQGLKEWLKGVDPKPSWGAVVDVLKSVTVGEHRLAEKLEEKYCHSAQQPDSTELDSVLFVRLKTTLNMLKQFDNTPNKSSITTEAVQKFIASSIQTGERLEVVEEQLHSLHKELLISGDMLKKALEMATQEHETHTPSPRGVSNAESTQFKPTDPLFSKDTLYHAGICSHVVSTCDPGDYQKFFKNKDIVPGHSFKAVSLSRSKRERFLIAKMGESTYYFAFQSEPHLLEWGKQFNSFSDGIMSQSGQFPVRFIVELLNKQCRIVLTGFSFGGVLACAVAARVWDTPYISSDLLKDNMTCITFGQPHVAVDVINKVMKRRPEIVSTLHAVYLEDDLIPSLMRFLDESWSAQSVSERGENVHVEVPVPFEMRAPFKDPVTSTLLEKLTNIQDMSTVSDEAIVELKSKLKEVLSKTSTHQLPLSTTSYQISCEGSTGLEWSKMTAEQVSESTTLKNTLVVQLGVDVFVKHSIKEYTESLFIGHLDKSPKYDFPPPSKHAPSEVGDLKPSISEVHIHHHGNETAIVLEGSNIWFSHQVSFGGRMLKISAQDITGSSIQFNIPREGQEIHTKGNSKERISLQCHFSKPIRDDITVHEKGYSITTRQEQLARLTPSQVIELGYLSALLEQHPYSKVQPSSHKLEVIAKFLEEVVRVVPFESIAYAIANASYDTAVMCYEALMSCGIELPISDLMHQGLLLAAQRMTLGYPGRILQTLNVQARESVPLYGFQTISCDEEREEITLSVSPRGLGLTFPFEGSTSFTTNVRQFKSVQSPINNDIGMQLHERSQTILRTSEMKNLAGQTNAYISGLNIEVLYPVVKGLEGKTKLNSPLDILTNGRRQLADLARKSQDQVDTATNYNQEMLKCVNDIRNKELDMCTSLLGGFMDQQEIEVALVKPSLNNSSESLGVFASASVGVWALFSLDYSKVEPLLTRCRGDQLLVKILDYVQSISEVHTASEDSGPYAAKLQFMVQGMTKTVTCNTQHISYSLERQLVELCRERKINAETSLDDLIKKWSGLFKGNIFSLVDFSCRPLIARWLKWALMIHSLREELARYTAVGVVGLVNSGKSKLVNTLFGIPIPTGTTEVKRTTVPFLYNLDESVKGLNVVDYPGVDDEDDTIGELADLLLTIAQIILFIVDYRKVHTQSTKKWLERLQKEEVPVLVCLTFGDKLYAEQMSKKGDHPSKDDMKHLIKEQFTVIEGKLRPSYSHKVEFFSFSQDNDSVLNNEEGREMLRDVGIGSPQQVGEWLVRVFRKDFGQDKVADRLESFMSKNIEKA